MQLPGFQQFKAVSLIPQKETPVLHPMQQTRSGKPPSLRNWLRYISPQTSISNKIFWGYGISLGVAFLGVSGGLIVGNHYQQEARSQLRNTQEQGILLSQLQVTMSDFQPEREFVPNVRNIERFHVARTQFFQRVSRIELLLNKLRNTVSLEELKTLEPFLVAFETTVQSYTEELEIILQTIQPEAVQPQEIPVLEETFHEFANGPTYLELFRYSDELTTLIERVDAQNRTAEMALDRAESLRNRIIVASMVVSIAIATLLAIYTSHAIARPIKSVTRVAQDVTDKGDFELRSAVITHDEVGVLATSLNQLIEWVASYTRELQETQTQLIQTEKMSSLGQMVAGVAHEINNPVNFIYGNLSHTKEYTNELLNLIHLYQQEYPNPTPAIQQRQEEIDLAFLEDDLPKLMASMHLGADRIRQIVLSLRNFSRLDEAEMKPIDLHEGIDSTLLLLNGRIKRNIAIEKHYGELPLVECYPAQINQVFMNILSNAIDALMEKKETEIKTIRIQTEHQNEQVIIRIQDNGPGIPTAIINKLFDPFFTTKPVGQGTGLGLAIAYQIVEKHQGKIQIASDTTGTELTILLPIKVQD